jgi:hypothetical protein
MTALRTCVDSPRSAAEALGRAAALAEEVSVEDASAHASLYATELTGEALILGAHQHRAHALAADLPLPSVRRATGGGCVWGGAGVLYASLALRDASALVTCPPGKLLNRYVRGALTGLRALNLPAHYFGRDFVSLDALPVGYIGWAQARSGLCRIELFLAHTRPFAAPAELSAYPAPSEPAFRGRALTTLEAASPALEAGAVLQALVDGHARTFDARLERSGLHASELARAELLARQASAPDEPDGLFWSAPHEEVIGFVSAGVALDGAGLLRAVRVRGDFFMHDACEADLEERLAGKPPKPEVFAEALDGVLAARLGLIEGVRSLRTLHAALLDAAGRARAVLETRS